jgi:hypothetical protein
LYNSKNIYFTEVTMAVPNLTNSNSTDTSLIGFRLPTLNDIVQGIRKGGELLDQGAQRAVNAFENLSPLEQGIIGVIPFGDAIDLLVQTHKQAKGKGADPVVVTLSALGLAADLGTVSGVGLGFNASISAIKVAYKSMSAVGKAAMKNVFAEAAKNPKAMKNLVNSIVELAKDGTLLKLTTELRELLPDILATGLLKGAKAAVHKARSVVYDRNRSSSDKGDSTTELNTASISSVENSISTSQSQDKNESISKQRYDAIAALLEENGVLHTDPNWPTMMAQAATGTKIGINDVAAILEHSPEIRQEQALKLAQSADKQLVLT